MAMVMDMATDMGTDMGTDTDMGEAADMALPVVVDVIIVLCVSCSTVLYQSTGGKARLTAFICSFSSVIICSV